MIDVDAALHRLRARNPHAVELATLASPAVQVEPELLRDLRMLIPDADPGAEADLWLSDLVDSKGPLGMELLPEVRATLQDRLRSDRAALERAEKAVTRAHAGLSEVLKIEEELTFHALKGEIDEARLEQLLAPIIARLDQDAHAGLARWALRAFAEMPPSVRDSNVVWHLLRASSVARVVRRTEGPQSRSDFKYDIFVNYAHADDSGGLVRTLVKSLQQRVSQLLGRAPQIYLDNRIEVDTNVLQVLLDAIAASRIFLVVLSPRYLASTWNQMDLTTFLERGESAKQNIFIVEAERMQRERWPAALRDMKTVAFWEEDPQGRRPVRLDPQRGKNQETFIRRADELAHSIAARLRMPDPEIPSAMGELKKIPRVRVALRLRGNVLEIDTAPGIDVLSPFLDEGMIHWLDLPATNPMMLELSWGSGGKRTTQRIAFTPGDQFHQPLAADVVRVRTLADDEYRLMRRFAFEDWAVVVGSGSEIGLTESNDFLGWLRSPAGGRVPNSNLIAVAGLDSAMSAVQTALPKRVHRLYLHYAAPPLGDDAIGLLRSVLAGLSAVASELVVIVDSILSSGNVDFLSPDAVSRLTADQRRSLVIFGTHFREEPSATSRILDGLRGSARNSNREITAASLQTYLLPYAKSGFHGISVWFGENFVLREVASDSGELPVPAFDGLTVTLRRTEKRRVIRGTAPPRAVEEFTGPSVVVAGTPDAELSTREVLIIESLAPALAEAGYGLIVGSGPAADARMAETFARHVRDRGGNVKDRLRQYVMKPFFAVVDVGGTILEVDDEAEAAFADASALLRIANLPITLQYVRLAREHGLPEFRLDDSVEELDYPLESDISHGFTRGAANEIVTRVMNRLVATVPLSGTARAATPKKEPMVYVIHVSEDRERVAILTSTLQARGINVWNDRQELQSGDDWNKVTDAAINSADYVIVLQTEKMLSRREGFFFREIRQALARQMGLRQNARFLIPVRTRNSRVMQELEQFQAIEIDESRGADELANVILDDWRRRSAGGSPPRPSVTS